MRRARLLCCVSRAIQQLHGVCDHRIRLYYVGRTPTADAGTGMQAQGSAAWLPEAVWLRRSHAVCCFATMPGPAATRRRSDSRWPPALLRRSACSACRWAPPPSPPLWHGRLVFRSINSVHTPTDSHALAMSARAPHTARSLSKTQPACVLDFPHIISADCSIPDQY